MSPSSAAGVRPLQPVHAARAALALLLPLLVVSCSAPGPEPVFQSMEPGNLLSVKIYDAWRTAGKLKGTALVVFELPEDARFVGKPAVTVNGQLADRVRLSTRQASVDYYPVSDEWRLETRPVTVACRWRGAGKDKAERTGLATVVLRYGTDLGISVSDCEVTEEKAPPKEPAAAPAPAGPAAPTPPAPSPVEGAPTK